MANKDIQLIHVFESINVKFVVGMDISPALVIKIQTTNLSRVHNSHRAGLVVLDHLLSIRFVQRKDTLLLIASTK